MRNRIHALAAVLALTCLSAPAFGQLVQAPPYKSDNTPVPSVGVFLLCATGTTCGTAANPLMFAPAQSTPATPTLVSGTPYTAALPTNTSAMFQIAGLNADSLLVQQSLDCTNYVTATVLKQDLSTTVASALTGAAANGIYSVMVFGGCLKITRTGSADTLTMTVKGVN